MAVIFVPKEAEAGGYIGESGDGADWIPTIVHVESHAGIVAELAQARRMIASAERIVVKGSSLERAQGHDVRGWLQHQAQTSQQKLRETILLILSYTKDIF